MTTIEIDPTRMEKLQELAIQSGSHEEFSHGVCAMEAVAWLAGEQHSDHPECACPVISAFMRRWNDRLPSDDDRNLHLRPLLPLLVGSRSTKAIERRRGWMATDWSVRTQTPILLRRAGLEEHAAKLELLPEVTDDTVASVRTTMAEARSAAWAQRSATWPAGSPTAYAR